MCSPWCGQTATPGSREFALLRWGLVPFWAKDPKFGYSTINARAEEAASKPAFRDALKKRRCLVPADAFYEWQRLDPKTKRPFAFALKSGEPYAFAGLWDSWQGKDNEALETFTILTTDPNELMEPVHNRMPVILEPKDYDRWLDPETTERPPSTCCGPIPAERMRSLAGERARGQCAQQRRGTAGPGAGRRTLEPVHSASSRWPFLPFGPIIPARITLISN